MLCNYLTWSNSRILKKFSNASFFAETLNVVEEKRDYFTGPRTLFMLRCFIRLISGESLWVCMKSYGTLCVHTSRIEQKRQGCVVSI